MPFYNQLDPAFVPSVDTTSVGFGINTLASITTGIHNTGLGNNALNQVTTGNRNIAVGGLAGDSATTGSDNTYVGHNAGTTITTGSNNTYIGSTTAQSATTGSNNTIIGYNADVSGATVSNTVNLAGVLTATGVGSTNAVTIPGTLTTNGNLALATTAFILGSATDAITAHSGGGSGSATQLVSQINRISTTAADHDSVKLPASFGGIEISIDNDGVKVLDIYPSGSDTVEDGAGPITILAGADVTLVSPVTGKWYLQGSSAAASIPAAAAITVTSYMNGSTILLNTASGSVVTLPAATATGNVYKFVVTTTITSNAHKILAASSSDFLNGVAVGHIAAGTTLTFSAAAATAHSIQMPFSGTTPSGGTIGDWYEFTDVATNLWAVRGMYQSGTTSTTPFSAATS